MLQKYIKNICIVLYCIVLYCIVMYCNVLYCIILYCIVLYCIVLYYATFRKPHMPWRAFFYFIVRCSSYGTDTCQVMKDSTDLSLSGPIIIFES